MNKVSSERIIDITLEERVFGCIVTCEVKFDPEIPCTNSVSLPQQWLIDNIEESAEPLLLCNDHEEYRGLFEVYVRLDRRLTEKLAERAVNHTDPDIQEAGADFFNILRQME